MRHSTLLGGDRRERRDHLVHLFASAVWARHALAFTFRHVERLREFLVAILALKNILGHGSSPAIG